jgi:lambda family phage minor tail protein L
VPRTISSTALAEKNKLATDCIWYIALEIVIPGVTTLRVVRNNENITWDGQTWTAFPFELEPITEEGRGEVPRVDLRVSNVSRTIDQYLQSYDEYIKTNGYSPVTVEIFVLNSKNLSSATPEVSFLFELKQPRADAYWATFTLGAANPFNLRFPQDRFLKNHCRWVFKSTECGYSGSTTSCDKTLPACRNMNGGSNSERYGGFPGVGYGGIRLY